MLLFSKPATDSEWQDQVLHIDYTVVACDGNNVLVICRHGIATWEDELHISLFGTELIEVKR